MSFWLHDSWLIYFARRFSFRQRIGLSSLLFFIMIFGWLIIWYFPIKHKKSQLLMTHISLKDSLHWLQKDLAALHDVALQHQKIQQICSALLSDGNASKVKNLESFLSLLKKSEITCDAFIPQEKYEDDFFCYEEYLLTAHGAFQCVMDFFRQLTTAYYPPMIKNFQIKRESKNIVMIESVLAFISTKSKKDSHAVI